MTRLVADLGHPIRLDLNVAPFLNESAIRAAFESTPFLELAQYAEPDAPRLRTTLAARLGVPEDAIVVGNGSDELLDFVARALVPRGGSIGVLDPSFGTYDHVGRANEARVLRVPARDVLPVERLAALRADLLLLGSPNNPTGAAFPRTAFEALLSGTRAVVVVDEAYAEFADQDFRDLAASSDRAIVLRTFSKAYGLPGIRVGYAVGPTDVLARIHAIKMPYNVSTFGERAALAALEDAGYVARVVAHVAAERARLYDILEGSDWPVWPSAANFLFLGPMGSAAGIHEALKRRGILVKLVDWPGEDAGRSLRISVGTIEQNDALLDAFAEVSPRSA